MRVLHLAAGAGLIAALASCGGDGDDAPARDAELDRIRTEMAADAERRGGRPVLRVRCDPTARGDAPEGSLDCLAVTRESPESETIPVPIVLGQPYAARIDPETGAGDWCRITPIAGEGATPDPEAIEALPARCGGSGAR